MKKNSMVNLSSVFSTSLSGSVHPPSVLKQIRRADQFTSMSLLASSGVLEKAGINGSNSEDCLSDTGIFLGSVTGPLETNFRFLDGLLDSGEGSSSPTLFSHSVHNSAAGYIARIHNIRGPAITITKRTWPFLEALRIAFNMICTGRLKRAVVTGVEQVSPLIVDAMKKLAFKPETDSADSGFEECHQGSGAVAWLLEKKGEKTDGKLFLKNIDIMEKSCDAGFFLLRSGETWQAESGDKPVDKSLGLGNGYAMESIFALTAFVKALQIDSSLNEGQHFRWMVGAKFGSAAVEIMKGEEGVA